METRVDGCSSTEIGSRVEGKEGEGRRRRRRRI
jgi:hypothetical protein